MVGAKALAAVTAPTTPRITVNCPIVAYSGEIDRQKQAADVMEKPMAAEGIRLDAPHRP